MKTMTRLLIVGCTLGIATTALQCSDSGRPTELIVLKINSDAGLGTVTSDVGGIDCGTVCEVGVEFNTTVTLTATPTGQAKFLGWGGECSGTQPTCTLTLDASKSVDANWQMPDPPDMAVPPDMTSFPAPTVTSVSPASIVNNVATSLTLTGTNFRAGATVMVGGVACGQVNVVSPTQITCMYPGKAATCGGQGITVTQPDISQSGTLAAAMGLRLRSATLGFAAATNYPIGTGPRMAAVGDFNGDQKLDIAVPNANSNNVSVLLGNGNGGFGTATNFSVAAGSGPQGGAVADVNGV